LSLPEGNRSNQLEQEEVQRRQNEKRIEQGPKIPYCAGTYVDRSIRGPGRRWVCRVCTQHPSGYREPGMERFVRFRSFYGSESLSRAFLWIPNADPAKGRPCIPWPALHRPGPPLPFFPCLAPVWDCRSMPWPGKFVSTAPIYLTLCRISPSAIFVWVTPLSIA
jgi:hypothetical protein